MIKDKGCTPPRHPEGLERVVLYTEDRIGYYFYTGREHAPLQSRALSQSLRRYAGLATQIRRS